MTETTIADTSGRSHAYDFQDACEDAVKSRLSADAEWAAGLIKRLTNTGGDDAMKPGILNACEGLAFVRATKGGLGLTVASGAGFVIRKLEQDRFGNSRWSAPVYFNVVQLGLGAAVGYEVVESCLALMSLRSVAQFCSDHSVMGTDLGLVGTQAAMSGMPAGTFGRSSHMDVQADNANTVFAYSLSHGLLANISINGTETFPNGDLNRKLYGEMPLRDVLSGEAKALAELLPLYRAITDTAKKALE